MFWPSCLSAYFFPPSSSVVIELLSSESHVFKIIIIFFCEELQDWLILCIKLILSVRSPESFRTLA